MRIPGRGGPRQWEDFWFQEVPPHLYALLRICVGAIGILGVLGATPVSMFWAMDGLAPIPGDGLGIRQQIQALGFGTLAGWGAFAALLAAFVAMTLGWRSRIAVPVCFAGSLLQSYWNNLPLSAAHQTLLAVLFCLMWVDTGGIWSLSGPSRGGRGAADSPPANQPVWPLRLLRYQVSLIYLGSGLWKLMDPAWRDGSAIHFVANNNVFHRFPHAIPPQMDGVMMAATYVILAWELSFAVAVLHRWSRRVALLLGVLLHAGMWAMLELGPFSWLMVASYLAFLDPSWVSRTIRPAHILDAARRRFGPRRVRPTAAASWSEVSRPRSAATPR